MAILAPSPVPFQTGGAEKFWLGLRAAVSECPGCQADLIKLPSPENSFSDIVSSYRKFAELDLSHFDMVITSKYPAWLVKHPNHVIYLQHPLRGLYDTYHFTHLPQTLARPPRQLAPLMELIRKESPAREDLPAVFDLLEQAQRIKSLPSGIFDFPGPLIREVVHFFDRVAMAGAAAYLAISRTAREREGYFPPRASVKILHHPPDLASLFCGEGKYIFTASRLNKMKRLDLIVDAMVHVKGDVKLKIAGEGPEYDNLVARAAEDERIEFLGHVPDSALPQLYAGAICVPFTPYDEDYGLISVEAMLAGKPVLTTKDSGGPTELVQDGVNGFITEPSPEALGNALNTLVKDRALAARMGAEGRKLAETITWPKTARELLSHAALAAGTGGKVRPGVIVACAFPANPEGAGGQRRLYHYCSALAREFEVSLVCYGLKGQAFARSSQLEPHFEELSLPWPAKAVDCARDLELASGVSCGDIALMRHCAEDGVLARALASRKAGTMGVVASHPWLYPALKRHLPDLPLLYDAHNVETDLKTALLPHSPELAAEVLEVERECCKAAVAATACSIDDMARLGELCGVAADNFHLAPNGHAGISFAGAKKRRKFRRRLAYPSEKLALFLGSGHGPNVEAALAIVEMAGILPHVQFIIAGGASTQLALRKAAKPANVHLAGLVSEKVKNALLLAANVGLNPVLSGSGTNLKILEYLASGLQTISTPCGIRGIEGDFSQAVLIREIKDFPEAIESILRQPAREDILAAKSALAQAWAWPKALARLPALFHKIMGRQ